MTTVGVFTEFPVPSAAADVIGIDMPVLPLQQDPRVIVKLRDDLGICRDADFSPPASTATSLQFRDRSD